VLKHPLGWFPTGLEHAGVGGVQPRWPGQARALEGTAEEEGGGVSEVGWPLSCI